MTDGVTLNFVSDDVLAGEALQWATSFSSVDDLADKAIEAADGQCVRRLVIAAHGSTGSEGFMVFDPLLSGAEFIDGSSSEPIPPKQREQIEQAFARLKDHWCDDAIIEMRVCEFGTGPDGTRAMAVLADIAGVPVTAPMDEIKSIGLVGGVTTDWKTVYPSTWGQSLDVSFWRGTAVPLPTSSIGGQVIDGEGDAVPDQAVRVEHLESGTVYNTTTDARGAFLIEDLPAGGYNVSTWLPGEERSTSDVLIGNYGAAHLTVGPPDQGIVSPDVGDREPEAPPSTGTPPLDPKWDWDSESSLPPIISPDIQAEAGQHLDPTKYSTCSECRDEAVAAEYALRRWLKLKNAPPTRDGYARALEAAATDFAASKAELDLCVATRCGPATQSEQPPSSKQWIPTPVKWVIAAAVAIVAGALAFSLISSGGNSEAPVSADSPSSDADDAATPSPAANGSELNTQTPESDPCPFVLPTGAAGCGPDLCVAVASSSTYRCTAVSAAVVDPAALVEEQQGVAVPPSALTQREDFGVSAVAIDLDDPSMPVLTIEFRDPTPAETGRTALRAWMRVTRGGDLVGFVDASASYALAYTFDDEGGLTATESDSRVMLGATTQFHFDTTHFRTTGEIDREFTFGFDYADDSAPATSIVRVEVLAAFVVPSGGGGEPRIGESLSEVDREARRQSSELFGDDGGDPMYAPLVRECVSRADPVALLTSRLLPDGALAFLGDCVRSSLADLMLGAATIEALAGFTADPAGVFACVAANIDLVGLSVPEVLMLVSDPYARDWSPALLQRFADALEECFPLLPYYESVYSTFEFKQAGCAAMIAMETVAIHPWAQQLTDGVIDPTRRAEGQASFANDVRNIYAGKPECVDTPAE